MAAESAASAHGKCPQLRYSEAQFKIPDDGWRLWLDRNAEWKHWWE
ncbi:hypothetical protein [Terriglobus albidus]|nr:hypothetical protein [Terriglobus albidus]